MQTKLLITQLSVEVKKRKLSFESSFSFILLSKWPAEEALMGISFIQQNEQ
jgi:hypothetical protein